MRRGNWKLAAALVAGLLAVGCTVEPVPEETPAPEETQPALDLMTFTATLEQDASKTALDGAMHVVWNDGDRIRIFNAANPEGATFVLSGGAGSPTGTFTGTLTGEGPFYAVYPDDASARLNGTSIVTAFPRQQSYAAGSFGAGANLAAGKADTTDDLFFHNVCGALSLTLKGSATVRTVNIYTRGAELLSGEATVSGLDTDTPALALASAGAVEDEACLSLDCGAGVALNDGDGVKFILIVPAGALADGFTLEVIDDAGTAMVKNAKGSAANAIERSAIRPMPAFSYAAAYKAAFLAAGDEFGAYTHVRATDGAFATGCRYLRSQSQYSFFIDGGKRNLSFQDWTAGFALGLTLPATLDLGAVDVAVDAMGATGAVATKGSTGMKVIKKTPLRAWIADETDGTGYVVLL